MCNTTHKREASKMEHKYLIKKLKDIKIGHTEK